MIQIHQHPAVRALLRDQLPGDRFPGDRPPGAAGVPLVVEPADDMLRYTYDLTLGAWDQAFVHYVRSGLLAAQTVSRALAGRLPAAGSDLLDFACGYGRVTRFLPSFLPGARLFAADILAGAVDFQRRQLGVEALQSTAEPADFACPHRFDAIIVLSLFTHLPHRTFRAWLQRLLGLLKPGGVLLFSTHDLSLAPQAAAETEPGLRFEAQSEASTLAADVYGSTWVSEDYVRATVATLGEGALAVWRQPRGLWHLHDLYLVETAASAPAAAPDLRRGPLGHLDRCVLASPELLQLHGWACDLDALGSPTTIEVKLGDEVLTTTSTADYRLDVAQAHNDERFLHSGWQRSCRLRDIAVRMQDVLLVKAVGHDGLELVLYAGQLESALHYLPLFDTKAALATANLELAQKEHALSQARAEVAALRAALAHHEATATALRDRVRSLEASWPARLRRAWRRLRGKRSASEIP